MDYGMTLSNIPMFRDNTSAIKIAEIQFNIQGLSTLMSDIISLENILKMVLWNFIMFLLTNRLQIS